MTINTRKPQIAVCGWSGTGTREVSQQLLGRLERWKVVDPDYEKFEHMATERYPELSKKVAVATLERRKADYLCPVDFFCDSELLLRVNNKRIIANARLAAHFLPESFKVLLCCSDAIRFDRVAKSLGVSYKDAKLMTSAEEWEYLLRVRESYGLTSLEDQGPFDVVLNTEITSFEDTVDDILRSWYDEMCK
jgi:cytidylate kinase